MKRNNWVKDKEHFHKSPNGYCDRCGRARTRTTRVGMEAEMVKLGVSRDLLPQNDYGKAGDLFIVCFPCYSKELNEKEKMDK